MPSGKAVQRRGGTGMLGTHGGTFRERSRCWVSLPHSVEDLRVSPPTTLLIRAEAACTLGEQASWQKDARLLSRVATPARYRCLRDSRGGYCSFGAGERIGPPNSPAQGTWRMELWSRSRDAASLSEHGLRRNDIGPMLSDASASLDQGYLTPPEADFGASCPWKRDADRRSGGRWCCDPGFTL